MRPFFILILSLLLFAGCMNDGRIQFFYEDSLDRRQPLDYFLNIEPDNIPDDRIVFYSHLFRTKA